MILGDLHLFPDCRFGNCSVVTARTIATDKASLEAGRLFSDQVVSNRKLSGYHLPSSHFPKGNTACGVSTFGRDQDEVHANSCSHCGEGVSLAALFPTFILT